MTTTRTARAIDSALADLATPETGSERCSDAEYDRVCGPTLAERRCEDCE